MKISEALESLLQGALLVDRGAAILPVNVLGFVQVELGKSFVNMSDVLGAYALTVNHATDIFFHRAHRGCLY